MARKPYITSVRFGGFLSFPPDMPEFELKPLNVLIGPNASGKSNFLHGMRLLKSCTKDVREAIRDLGGADDVFYKSQKQSHHLEISCNLIGTSAVTPVSYRLLLEKHKDGRYSLAEEDILVGQTGEQQKVLHWASTLPQPIAVREVESIPVRIHTDEHHTEEVVEYEYRLSEDVVHVIDEQGLTKPEFPLLSQMHGWMFSTPALDIQGTLDSIWVNDLEKDSALTNVREEQYSDLPRKYPSVTLKNLGAVISDVKKDGMFRSKVFKYIKRVIPRFNNLDIDPHGNKLTILMYEDGISDPIPATRLSDGTLSFIYLTLLLLHPTPPSVICLEEPDAGLHPGAIHILADLLLDASARTQVVITTHSDLLVDAIGIESPESIVVCDRDEVGTKLTWPDPGQLKVWLEKYHLGELWLSGEIGGML